MDATFSTGHADSMRFAECSGDFNPLHIDSAVAGQSGFGGTIVHGVHAFLRAMDSVLDAEPRAVSLRSVRLRFHGPIPTGSAVASQIHVLGEQCSVQLLCENRVAQRNRFEWAESAEEPRATHCPVAFQREPAEMSLDQCGGATGSVKVGFDAALARKLFPAASRWLQPAQLGTLLSLSRIVGMECPGLRSLFMKCDGTFTPGQADSDLRYRTVETDDRLGLVFMDVRSRIFRGQIQAVLRSQ
jgi:acyl dehydratase